MPRIANSDRDCAPADCMPTSGLAEGTGGNFHAHIIKVNPEMHSAEGTTGMHRHDYDLQFNYVLSGVHRFSD